MPKAVISNRIYLTYNSEEECERYKKALTYKIVKPSPGKGKLGSIEFIRNYKLLPKNIISIPQGRTDLIPEGYEIMDKRVLNDMPFPEPKVPLREEQLKVFNDVNDTCFINALVGWGKTFVALHIARKLAQKTLIITHTTLLRDQWVEEIEKLFGMQAGIIGSGHYDIDSAIVVGNVQSLTKYKLELSKEFGTIILDECHHVSATTFSELIDTSYARYRIGLSGTMVRKDEKHVVFPDYFGHTVHKPPQSHTLNPVVKIIKPGITLTPGQPWVKKINNLLYDPDYQEYVATIVQTQLRLGYRVLLVASRVEFLSNIKEYLGDSCVLVTGSTDFEERKKAAEAIEDGSKLCIIGSRQIFSEGISVNRLDCLILPEPISNEVLLEQLVGRIMRKHDDKKEPVVIDVMFSGAADRKQNNLRLGFYMKKGWVTKSI
jgi:superfamily II DNA or RNA helicase